MSALSQVNFSPVSCGLLSALGAFRSQSPDILQILSHYTIRWSRALVKGW